MTTVPWRERKDRELAAQHLGASYRRYLEWTRVCASRLGSGGDPKTYLDWVRDELAEMGESPEAPSTAWWRLSDAERRPVLDLLFAYERATSNPAWAAARDTLAPEVRDEQR